MPRKYQHTQELLPQIKEMLAQGMTLVFGEHSVRMTPAGNGLTVAKKK